MSTPTVDRRRLGLEVLIVLGVSLGQSAVYSVLRIADRLTRVESLNQQTTTMNSSTTPDRPWLDLTYQLAGIIFALVPVLLVLYLLRGTHRDPFRLIGLDHRRPVFDAWFGTVIAACIGIPGLGLYLGARALGLNTDIAAANLADNWWTIPVLVLAAFQNSILEEVIMVGYLFTRLRALRWGWLAIVLTSAVVRGSYHLYQGFGGFVGNLIMGIVFGLVYLKWKRVAPLVVAHALLDIAAFVGYALAAPHLSWL
ncbi:MAG: CPBP family intramembrane glutamic endopeptidase [Propionibacteriaceae bacterium]